MSKHSFFFAAAFMALLVIGSVVGYSVILPQKAPKQITLAVLPFAENGESSKLSLGFTAALRDSLALSRDVVVVDTISTMSVIWEEKSSSEVASMLALTHLVDGEISTSVTNDTTVSYRVLNVSHPTWKEVVASETRLENGAVRPWQAVRDELTRSIRQSLYDNNSMRTESLEHDRHEYLQSLHEAGELLQQLRDSPRGEFWIDVLQEKYERSVTSMRIAPDVFRMSANAVRQFQTDADFESYGAALWELTDEYPSSSALTRLAQLSYELGEFNSAEQLWLRVARLKPQSAYVALRIADVRWREGDLDGAFQALRIAKIRSNDSQTVSYFNRVRASFNANDPMSQSVAESEFADDSLRSILSELGESETGFDLAIHLGKNEEKLAQRIGKSRIWLKPPIFMDEEDRRWIEFQETVHKGSNVYRKVLDAESVIPQIAEEDAVAALFMPRRPD